MSLLQEQERHRKELWSEFRRKVVMEPRATASVLAGLSFVAFLELSGRSLLQEPNGLLAFRLYTFSALANAACVWLCKPDADNGHFITLCSLAFQLAGFPLFVSATYFLIACVDGYTATLVLVANCILMFVQNWHVWRNFKSAAEG